MRDGDTVDDLKSDIAFLQGKGGIVKLAYGGEEWGNINPDQMVKYQKYFEQ